MSDAPMGELISRRIRDPNSLLHRNLTEAGIPGIRYLDEGSRWMNDPFNVSTIMMPDANKYVVYGPGNVTHATFADRAAANAMAEAENAKLRTHNYVIFDPNKIDIRKMYAVPGAVGAGGIMGGIAAQDNYQPQ
jgi:hypothetical protein